jgi:hypothetical protein
MNIFWYLSSGSTHVFRTSTETFTVQLVRYLPLRISAETASNGDVTQISRLQVPLAALSGSNIADRLFRCCMQVSVPLFDQMSLRERYYNVLTSDPLYIELYDFRGGTHCGDQPRS